MKGKTTSFIIKRFVYNNINREVLSIVPNWSLGYKAKENKNTRFSIIIE